MYSPVTRSFFSTPSRARAVLVLASRSLFSLATDVLEVCARFLSRQALERRGCAASSTCPGCAARLACEPLSSSVLALDCLIKRAQKATDR